MVQRLVKESGYEGRYVALKSFEDSTVISDGTTPQGAYDKAVKKGILGQYWYLCLLKIWCKFIDGNFILTIDYPNFAFSLQQNKTE